MTMDEMEKLKNPCANLKDLTFRYKHNSQHGMLIDRFAERNKLVRNNRGFFGTPSLCGYAALHIVGHGVWPTTKPQKIARGVDVCGFYLSGCSALHILTLLALLMKSL